MKRARILLVAALAAALAPAARAELALKPVIRFDGLGAGGQLGYSLARAGDVNGDGFVDFLLGAPALTVPPTEAGCAYLFLGGLGLDSLADAVMPGRVAYGHAGLTVAAAGDVNGDGSGDWLVASPHYLTGQSFIGRVFLYYGGARIDSVSDRFFDPPPGIVLPTQYGISMTPAGDFNGDGFDDFMLAGLGSSAAPTVFLYFGGPALDRTPDLALQQPPGYVARSASHGDVNGDGWSDLVLGMPGAANRSAGKVAVFFGGPSADALPDLEEVVYPIDEGFGVSVASGGDLNGDGYQDFVVGSPGRSADGRTASGEILVYFGGPGVHATPDRRVAGRQVAESFGYSLAIDGDLDGDGIDDLVIGAPGATGAAGPAGRVYVAFGKPGFTGEPDLYVDGEAAGDQLGFSVAFAGDPDRSGRETFLAGANYNDAGGSQAGRVTLFRVTRFEVLVPGPAQRWEAGGRATVEWTGGERADVELSLDDGAHWRTLATDAGGLAHNELEVAVPDETSGRARLRLTVHGAPPGAGASSFSVGNFHVVRSAPAIPAVLGPEHSIPSVSGASGTLAAGVDADGDGVPDVAAGSPWTGDGAVAIVAEGAGPAAVPHPLTGASPLERFGAAVANAGDLDGDGWADLAVGAPHASVTRVQAGRVYVFRGGPSADDQADWVLDGPRAYELFGSSVAAAGDANGDGYADIVVGAPASGEAGRAYVFYGGPGFGGQADQVLTAGVPGPFGALVAGAGDVNGDGRADLLVTGLPLAGANGAGVVHLYFGQSGPGSWSQLWIGGEQASDGFGAAMAGLGDLDGDGLDDFAIGAPFADVSGKAAAGLVRVYFGSGRFLPVPGLTLSGTEGNEQFGSSIAGGVDVNGDGRSDFAIGSIGARSRGFECGRVDLFFGGDDRPDLQVAGDPGTRFGSALAMSAANGGPALGRLYAGSPFTAAAHATADAPLAVAGGALRAFDVVRWRFDEPAAPVEWLAGSRQRVRWQGAAPADLWYVAGPGEESLLLEQAGGSSSNALDLDLDPRLPDHGRLELRAALPGARGVASSAAITLRRVVTLRRFEWEPSGDGVALRWSTDPPLGERGLAGFRLFRIGADGTRQRIGALLVVDSSAVDPAGRAGDAYDLVAVASAGEEYAAGTLALPGVPDGIRAWPQPAGERGEVRFEFAAPRAGNEVATDLDASIFDVRGRRVRVLALGRPGTRAGLVELGWNGRDDRGSRLGPGIYFLRVRAPSAGFERVRRVVMLDTPAR